MSGDDEGAYTCAEPGTKIRHSTPVRLTASKRWCVASTFAASVPSAGSGASEGGGGQRSVIASMFPTPAEAARGQDFVMACVGNDDDLRAVTTGRDGAFAAMQKGAARPTDFFSIPPNRVVEMGMQIEM